ncbi:hypothetical protein D1007_10328 [Hordeum vulgare]|nr:hypothetical protein D1007_10328 [Hordeum vulgare]
MGPRRLKKRCEEAEARLKAFEEEQAKLRLQEEELEAPRPSSPPGKKSCPRRKLAWTRSRHAWMSRTRRSPRRRPFSMPRGKPSPRPKRRRPRSWPASLMSSSGFARSSTHCPDGFDEPLATPEGGFAPLAADLAVALEYVVNEVDKMLDSECRDLFSEATARVFSHLHPREPGFDFGSVILSVPTKANESTAEAVKGPVEALVKRFACVAVRSSRDVAEVDGGEGDATDDDDDDARPEGGVTGGSGLS